jgi:hypothetical protein
MYQNSIYGHIDPVNKGRFTLYLRRFPHNLRQGALTLANLSKIPPLKNPYPLL